MERYIGLDVHASSCTLAIVSGTGRRLRDFPVETSGQALVEAISAIPGHRPLIMEEGTQSAWLYETLERHVDEIVVANVRESRGQKSHSRDAYGDVHARKVQSLRANAIGVPEQRAARAHADVEETAAAREARQDGLVPGRGERDDAQAVEGYAHEANVRWTRTDTEG